MKSIRLFALFCATALLSLAPVPAAARPELVHLVVLHTNDVHGQLLSRPATWVKEDPVPQIGGIERAAAYVQRVRAEHEGRVLFLDGGDWFQGTPEGLIEGGQAFLEVLKKLDHDVMCVGNHEFDYGVEPFLTRLHAVGLPAVLAGVVDEEGHGLRGIPPYRIVERAGLRIAVVGLLTVTTPEITHDSTRAWFFREPSAALKAVREELAALEPPIDLVVPLTHIGVNSDRVLARHHPDLPLVVGGHSHTFLREGERQGDTMIVQAGSRLSAVGRVDLWFDPAEGRVTKLEATTVSLFDEVPEGERDPELAKLCDALVARSAAHMDAVVGELAMPLTRGREPYASSTAGNFITDAMRARAQADVAIQNRGGIRSDVAAGPITRRDLFEILPFGNNLVTLTMSGKDLEMIVRRGVEGMAHTGLEFSGLEVHVEPTESGGRLSRLFVGGEPLRLDMRLRVATNSFLAGGGDGYIELAAIAEREHDPILLRELLGEVFERGEPVRPADDNRYRLVRE